MQSIITLLPINSHSAIIYGQTGCSKKVFILDLLEKHHRGVFKHIAVPCPAVKYNKAYQERDWVWKAKEI